MKNNFFSKLIAGVVLAATLGLSSAARAASTSDTLVIIDESGSMGGEQAWIQNMIQALDVDLQAAGVTNNRYGLVGFGKGGSGRLGRSINVGSGLFGNAADFASAAANDLVTSGSFEDGYSGIDFALNNYTFRGGAAKNIIFVTDEDRDNGNSGLNFASTLSSLQSGGFLFNSVLNNPFSGTGGAGALGVDFENKAYYADGAGGVTSTPGGIVGNGFGSTETDYVPLSLQTRAASWDLNQLRQGGLVAESFTKAFVDIKVQEIITDPGDGTSVPEPASVIGLGVLAAAGAVSVKRKSQQRHS
ncbi:MAG: PEP-CTERM sorting domain-containing protein [Cyanobacteria bacterium J06627_28]